MCARFFLSLSTFFTFLFFFCLNLAWRESISAIYFVVVGSIEGVTRDSGRYNDGARATTNGGGSNSSNNDDNDLTESLF